MEVVWLMLISVLLAALFAGGEIGIYAFNPLRLDRSSRRARFVIDFFSRKESLVALCLVGHNLFLFLATICFESSMDSMGIFGKWRYVVDALVFAPFIFLAADVYPKGFFKAHATVLMPRLTGVFIVSKFILMPVYLVIQVIIKSLRWIFRGEGSDLSVTPQHLHWLIQDQNPGSADTAKIVSRIMGLTDLPVSILMEPLSRVRSVPSDMPHDGIQAIFMEGQEDRIIVRDTKDPGSIFGVVTLNTALLAKGGTAKDLATQMPTVQHKASVSDALTTLKDAASPMCRIQGSNGVTIGILYTRRIVSEIVGDGGIW